MGYICWSGDDSVAVAVQANTLRNRHKTVSERPVGRQGMNAARQHLGGTQSAWHE
jgi:hypothetical protein